MENQPPSNEQQKPKEKNKWTSKKIGCVVIFILFWIILVIVLTTGGDDNSSSKQTANQEWYSGGTLHQATIDDWKTASDKNKLATSADMMAVVDNTVSMDELRARAESLKDCIDEATDIDETVVDDSLVSEIGALCIISSGYGN